MTWDEFQKGIQKLQQHTGRALRKEQVDSWWEEVKSWDGSSFVRACHSLAQKHNQFPTISDVSTEIRERAVEQRTKTREKVSCPRCDGTGVIPFFRVSPLAGLGQMVSARCSCPNGQRMSNMLACYDNLFPDQKDRTFHEYVVGAIGAEAEWISSNHRLLVDVPGMEGRRGRRSHERVTDGC